MSDERFLTKNEKPKQLQKISYFTEVQAVILSESVVVINEMNGYHT